MSGEPGSLGPERVHRAGSLSGVWNMMRTWNTARSQSIPGTSTTRFGLALLAIALFLFFSLRNPNFADVGNATTIALAMSSIAIAVVGSAALLISGNVDLSIGSMYALVAAVVAQVAVHSQSPALAVVVGITLGALLGTLNGILVRLLGISPLIVTIGLLAVYRGLAFVATEGGTVFGFPDGLTAIGRQAYFGVAVPVWVAVAIFVVGSFLLVRTRTGLRIYAIGGDSRSAELSGVPVARTVVGLYGLNGLLIGVVAVLVVSRLGTASPQLGLQFEFDVLTAAILGGVAFVGGAGRPFSVFIGVVTIGILNAGLIFEGLADYYQQVARGTLLVAALAADQILASRRRRRVVSDNAGEEAAFDDTEGSEQAQLAPRARETAERPVVLKARGLSKSFGPVAALDQVDLTVRAGEVVCLLGDNGAGKSTLIKILSGAVQPDEGEVRVNGQPLALSSARDAQAAGIHTVFQDLAVCANLSVVHNMVLGDEPTKRFLWFGRVRDERAALERAKARLRELGVNLPNYRTLVGDLSGGQRQSVAIARAMGAEDSKVAILDEPTAALGVKQTSNVMALVRSVADRGVGVVLITHDVRTVFAVADTVVVLRLGRVVHSGPVGALDELTLLGLMAGFTGSDRSRQAGVAHVQ